MSVSLLAEVTAKMDLEAKLAVNTAFALPNVNLVFPSSAGPSSGGNVTPQSNQQRMIPFYIFSLGTVLLIIYYVALQLSVGDSTLNTSGQIDAHLIPRVRVFA